MRRERGGQKGQVDQSTDMTINYRNRNSQSLTCSYRGTKISIAEAHMGLQSAPQSVREDLQVGSADIHIYV